MIRRSEPTFHGSPLSTISEKTHNFKKTALRRRHPTAMARLSSLFVALGLVLVALTAVVDSFAHSHLGGAVSCSRWGHHHRMPHGGLGVTPASRRPFSPAVAQLRIEDLYSADELEEMTEAEKRAAMNDIGAYAESNMDDSDDMYGDGDGSGGGGVDEAGIKAAARSSILSGGPRGEDSGGKSEAEKKARKVKKSLKRIGQLRKMDYLSLTNDQRTKVHSEPGRRGVPLPPLPPLPLPPPPVATVTAAIPSCWLTTHHPPPATHQPPRPCCPAVRATSRTPPMFSSFVLIRPHPPSSASRRTAANNRAALGSTAVAHDWS